MICPMTTSHTDMVVGIHLRSFRNFFLSFLGPRFLRLYYEGIMKYPDGAGYVYVEEEHIVGFVCGVLNPSRFYRYLLRTSWWRFALAALGAAVRRPSIIPRLFRALLYPRQASGQMSSATLTSIAVDPAMQGEGIGTKLVAAFLEDMRARGVETVNLTTDRHNNDAANSFYRRLGFHCARTFVTPEGREMNEYVICL